MSLRPHLSVVPRDASLDDAELVERVRAGEPGLATLLVQRAGPRAKAAVRRLLRHPTDDDDDLTQLVLIELVASIDRFRGECSLNTWVERIAAHIVYKRLRRRKLERRLFEGLGEQSHNQPSNASAERRPLTQNLLRRIQESLRLCDTDKVSVWLMFDVYGLSLEEVAHALETSVSAAQTRVSRARREVRSRLECDTELVDALSALEAAS